MTYTDLAAITELDRISVKRGNAYLDTSVKALLKFLGVDCSDPKHFLRYDYILGDTNHDNKTDWFTVKGSPLTNGDFSDIILGVSDLALKLPVKTKYVVLDIDRGSQYHFKNSKSQFDKLLETAASIGLNKPVIIQSSQSQGIHIYYPLGKAVYSWSANLAITYVFKQLGLTVANGQLEIFPKRSPKNNYRQVGSLRVPMSSRYSYLIDNDSLECIPAKDRRRAIASFLSSCKAATTHNSEFIATHKGLSDSAIADRYKFLNQIAASESKPYQSKTYLDMVATQAIIDKGLAGSGQSNQLALHCCQVANLALHNPTFNDCVNEIVRLVKSAPGYDRWYRDKRGLPKKASDLMHSWVDRYGYYGGPAVLPSRPARRKPKAEIDKRTLVKKANLKLVRNAIAKLKRRKAYKLDKVIKLTQVAEISGVSVETVKRFNYQGLLTL